MTGEAGRALAGRRLLVLVPEGGSRQLAEGLERNGAQVLVEALTRTEVLAPDELSAVNAWLDGNQVVDWIVLTSALGVRRLAEQASLLTVDLTARWSPPTRVAAIGPATARALVELGRTPELVAEDPRSEGLAAQLLNAGPGGLAGQTVLLIRALVGRPELIEALAATGAHVLVAPVYRTVMIQGAAERLAARLRSEVPAIDLLIVTSGAPW